MTWPTSDELCRQLADETSGVCFLSFSRGKDSIGAWLQLRRFFPRVIPFYLYSIPGLRFEAESIAYYEKFFGCHITRLPHPRLYRCLNALMFQAPQNIPAILAQELPTYGYDLVEQVLREDFALPGAWIADGVRRADSMRRHCAMEKTGPQNFERRLFRPIWDWSNDRLRNEIRESGVQLPVDYEWFGRTFDGYQYLFLEPLKRFAPDDYQRVLDFFPLAELELRRIEYRKAYYADATT